MKKNSIKISILSLLFIVALGTGVMAVNNEDTFTQMTGGNWGAVDYSAERQKGDTTPVYFNPTYFSNNQSGDYFIMGVKPGSGTGSFWTNYTPKITYCSGPYHISTLAYENYGACNIKLQASSIYRLTYSYYMGGVWSPDSM